ncbi:hypothetical protein ALC56_07101, partial [Trachymyrmex septentrionalis]
VTETDTELKKDIEKLLLDSIFYYNRLKITEETYFDYQESFKLHNSEIIENDKVDSSEDNLNFYPQMMTQTVLIKDFDSSYRRQAVEYSRNWNVNEKNKNKRNCPLKSVQNKFRKISSERRIKFTNSRRNMKFKSRAVTGAYVLKIRDPDESAKVDVLAKKIEMVFASRKRVKIFRGCDPSEIKLGILKEAPNGLRLVWA